MFYMKISVLLDGFYTKMLSTDMTGLKSAFLNAAKATEHWSLEAAGNVVYLNFPHQRPQNAS